MDIPLEQLEPPTILLRQVDPYSVEYLELRDSVSQWGVMSSITVRATDKGYQVIDGMYRYTVSIELELPTIPATVIEATDEEVLVLQLQANAVRAETRPVEYATQLRRIQKGLGDVTVNQLATIVSKSPHWVKEQLSLLRLPKQVQQSIDRGEICLANAHQLRKIPPGMLDAYLDNAKVMKSKDFVALVRSVAKQYREALKQGRLDAFYTEDFQPIPVLRSLKQLIAERKSWAVGPFILAENKCETPLEGWKLAVQWMLHLDKESARQQEEKALKKQRKKS